MRGWKRDQWNGVSDRDAGVGGELFETHTMLRRAGLSRGSPVIVRKIIILRFAGKKKGSPVGEPWGGVGRGAGQRVLAATGMRIP